MYLTFLWRAFKTEDTHLWLYLFEDYKRQNWSGIQSTTIGNGDWTRGYKHIFVKQESLNSKSNRDSPVDMREKPVTRRSLARRQSSGLEKTTLEKTLRSSKTKISLHKQAISTLESYSPHNSGPGGCLKSDVRWIFYVFDFRSIYTYIYTYIHLVHILHIWEIIHDMHNIHSL